MIDIKAEAAKYDLPEPFGVLIGEQIAEMIHRLNPQTQEMLAPAIPRLFGALAMFCPAVMVPSPKGVITHCGPVNVPDDSIVVAVATPKVGIVIATNDIPDMPEIRRTLPRAALWKGVCLMAEQQSAEGICKAIGALIDGDVFQIISRSVSTLRAEKLTPVLAVVAGATDDGAAGACRTIALPPSLDLSHAHT